MQGHLKALVATVAASFVVAPGAAAAPTRSCGWLVVGGASQVNALFPDQAATYWVSNLPLPPGGSIELHGQFPHARYMSMTTYTSERKSIDGLHDSAIIPDPGSSNPFIAHARRDVTRRWFTVRIVKAQAPARGRAPNTIYTTSADGSKSGGAANQSFSLRIYEPDRGRDAAGGVPLPDITLISPGGQRTQLPQCPDLSLPDLPVTSTLANAGTAQPFPVHTGLRGENPPVWRKFTSMGAALLGPAGGAVDGPEGGFGDNPDNKYVYTYFSQDFGAVLAFRARAPTFPATYDGEAVMGTGQLRYWSFCTNAPTTQVYACHNDDQIPTDAHGDYTVVISTAAARPGNATTRCGIAWIPAGPLSQSVVLLRNMLPDPSFAQAIQNAQPGTEQQTMGAYYPRGTYYATPADFERLGCHPGR